MSEQATQYGRHKTSGWEVRRRFASGREIGPDIYAGDEWIANIPGAPHLGATDSLPLAHLLSAAPDLLEAAHGVDAVYAILSGALPALAGKPEFDELMAIVRQSREAIKKATGG